MDDHPAFVELADVQARLPQERQDKIRARTDELRQLYADELAADLLERSTG